MSIVITMKIKEEEIYVSLIGPFMNMYAKVPYATNNVEARWLCNADRRLKSIWCSTYSKEKVDECIEAYGGSIIELYADGMGFDMFEFEQLRKSIKEHQEIENA